MKIDAHTDEEKRELRTKFLRAFRDCEIPAKDFASHPLNPAPSYLGPFLKAGTLGFLFAPRGLGKTWLSIAIGNAVAEGQSLGLWEAGAKPESVLYVDGEMAACDTKERLNLLGVTSNRLRFAHHEFLHEMEEVNLNLADPFQQEALLEFVRESETKVLIIDNLSTAFSGMRENESDSWEMVQPWLLQLRRSGVAVLIVAHAGRNGEMRGTSRREDMANYIVKLKPATEGEDEAEGARFVSVFTKNRGVPDSQAPPLLWQFLPESDGCTVKVRCEKHGLGETFLQLVRDGLDQNADIAAEMKVTPGTISKLAKRAEKEGKITIKNRRYAAVS